MGAQLRAGLRVVRVSVLALHLAEDVAHVLDAAGLSFLCNDFGTVAQAGVGWRLEHTWSAQVSAQPFVGADKV